MSRLLIVASVVALAAASANCADSAQANSMNLLGPSAVLGAGPDATMAKGSNGNGNGKPSTEVPESTISMVALDSSDGVPHFGQHVTFDVLTAATEYPWVTLRCYQNGVKVYDHSMAMYLGTVYSRTFTLGPNPVWQSGGADCTATLENWEEYSTKGKITAITSTQFAVAP